MYQHQRLWRNQRNVGNGSAQRWRSVALVSMALASSCGSKYQQLAAASSAGVAASGENGLSWHQYVRQRLQYKWRRRRRSSCRRRSVMTAGENTGGIRHQCLNGMAIISGVAWHRRRQWLINVEAWLKYRHPLAAKYDVI